MDDNENNILRVFAQEIQAHIKQQRESNNVDKDFEPMKQYIWTSGVTASDMVELVVAFSKQAGGNVRELYGSEFYNGDGECNEIEEACKTELRIFKRKMEYLLALIP